VAKTSGRSRRRTKANARRRVRGSSGLNQQMVSAQETMTFMRLRRHARWAFVLMAVIFAFGFAFAGVGSGSTGIGNLLNGGLSIFGGSGSSTPNVVKDAQKKLDKAEKSHDQRKIAGALVALGRAQSSKDRSADAEKTYARYLKLSPHDALARQELASLYLQKDAAGPQQGLSLGMSLVQQSNANPIQPSWAPDPLQAAQRQSAVTTVSETWKLYEAPTRKGLDVLAAGAFAKGGSQLLLSLGQSALQATGDAYQFAGAVPDSPQAAQAQKDEQSWGKLALRAWKAVLAQHPHDSRTKTVKQYVAELEALLGTSKSG
jgi:hypothetical protein